MPNRMGYCSAEKFIKRSWRWVSENAVRGASQKADAFWKRIYTDYEALIKRITYAPRTQFALKNRFSSTLASVCMDFQDLHQRLPPKIHQLKLN